MVESIQNVLQGSLSGKHDMGLSVDHLADPRQELCRPDKQVHLHVFSRMTTPYHNHSDNTRG